MGVLFGWSLGFPLTGFVKPGWLGEPRRDEETRGRLHGPPYTDVRVCFTVGRMSQVSLELDREGAVEFASFVHDLAEALLARGFQGPWQVRWC